LESAPVETLGLVLAVKATPVSAEAFVYLAMIRIIGNPLD
jgi:hypothetical protein